MKTCWKMFLWSMLLYAPFLTAQNTTVTATVVDSDSTAWANGTWTLSYTPSSTQPNLSLYTCSGTALVYEYTGALNGSGALSQAICSSANVAPSGGTWNLTVCPNASSACGNSNISVSGTSQNVSTSINAAIVAPRFRAISGIYGYADIEASLSLAPGSTYYNVTSSCQRTYSGSAWSCPSGSGSGTVTSFSAGTLSPLFTTSVATATTTPALTFSLSSAAQNSILAGPPSGGAAAPSYQTAPTFSAANLTNFPTFNQNTTGTAAGLTSYPTLCGGGQFSQGLSSGSNNCAAPSGSGTVNTGTATDIAYYATTGTAVSGNTRLTDSGTTFGYSGTGGITASAGPLTAGNPSGGVGSSLFLTQEGTTPSGLSTSGQDNCYADSTQHGVLCNFNAGTTLPVVQGPASDISGHVATFSGTNGGKIVDGTAVAANLVVAASPGVGLCHFAGSTQTCTSSAVVGGDMTNNTVTATQLATQYSKGSCTEVWGGSGTSFALTSGDDAIANNSCYNDSGGTRTITAVKCRSDNGTNTTTVNPTFGAAGTGTTVLSGALTCGNSYAYSSTGTVSNSAWTTGTGIDPVMGGTLTGTSIAVIVEYTF